MSEISLVVWNSQEVFKKLHCKYASQSHALMGLDKPPWGALHIEAAQEAEEAKRHDNADSWQEVP